MENINLCKKARRVLDLIDNPSSKPIIRDADTILADFVDAADCQETGIAAELINIWAKSDDRKSVEALFELLLDVSFEKYLDACIENTTR